MDNLDRLEKLLEGTNFMSFPDLRSQDPMKDLEEYNNREWEKLGNRRSESIWNLLWSVTADRLQRLALEKFGSTSDSAVRGVLKEILEESLQELESNQEWQELVKSCQYYLVSQEGMTPSKAEQCIKFCFVDYNVDFYASGIKQWEVLPRALSNETVDVLTNMFKEAIHVNN